MNFYDYFLAVLIEVCLKSRSALKESILGFIHLVRTQNFPKN